MCTSYLQPHQVGSHSSFDGSPTLVFHHSDSLTTLLSLKPQKEQLSYSYLCTVKSKSITGSSCHKYNFCHDKSMLVIIMFILTKLLLQQIFVVCLSWQKWYLHYFVTTKAMFCHDKHMFVFVTTKMILALFCHNKSQVLSWQTHVHICHNKNDTCIILSQQKSCFVMTNMC